MGWSGPVTQRQFRVWTEFHREPSRADLYTMQLTAAVWNLFSKQYVPMEAARLVTVTTAAKNGKKTKADPELLAMQGKADWCGRMGYPVTVVKRTEEAT